MRFSSPRRPTELILPADKDAMETNNGVQNFNFDLSTLMTSASPIKGHAEIENTVNSLFARLEDAVSQNQN